MSKPEIVELKSSKTILNFAFRIAKFIVLVLLSALFKENLFSNTKKSEKWNKDYDTYASEVTGKDDF